MKPKIVGVGVDYLTLTAQDHAGVLALAGWGRLALARAARLGGKMKATKRQGYTGTRCGSVFLGDRPDGAMVEISGSMSNEGIGLLSHELVRCTRIDLRVDVTWGEDREDLAAAISRAVEADQEAGDVPVPPSPRYHKGHGEGDGFTVGKRGCMRYGRIYDKWRESGDDAQRYVWRYEVEYRRKAARVALERLGAARWSDSAIAGLVGRQFRDWHVTPPWPADAGRLVASVGRRDWDSERALKWLKTQVLPTIDRLMGTVDTATILEALGLDKDAKPW